MLGHSFRGEPLELSVVSPGEFLGAFGKLRGKGFWILMTPAEPGARAAAGHAWIATGDTFFDRHGPWIVRSQDARHLAVGGEPQVSIERAYAIAQFFEVSEGSLNQLDHFMHDRVWQFNAGVGSYQPRFTERPLSHPHAGHWEENCLVFAYSWLFPEWKALRPEVQGVQVEFGDVRLSEVPSQQVFLNAEVPSYRGTLLISGHPEQALRHLREDGWNRDEAGRQLLFAEPLTPIGP